MAAGAIAMEMTFAEPGKGYISESGQPVQCEALAPRGKSRSKPSCAYFGSMETNPQGYAVSLLALAGIGILLSWSSRPGRGLRWSK